MVIAYRTIHLLSMGVSHKNILCLTFTNKASREMKERIREKRRGNLPRISTFHSLCFWILKREIALLGFSEKFNLYDSNDQRQIFLEVVKELKIDFNEEGMELIRRRISLAKNNSIIPRNYLVKDEIDAKVKDVYMLYQTSLKNYNALDFDDLICYTNLLFRQNQKIREKYQKRFHYIMVDEYQDTNRSQYLLARELSGNHRNLAVVGDDDQSIYSWRGADIRNILDFEKDYPDAKVIKLEENYRSTTTILEAANEVIKHNLERKNKRLRSLLGKGESIRLIEAENPHEEAGIITDDVSLKSLKHSANFRNFAVLYRTHSQSRAMEQAFIALKIPYHINGRINFYNRKEIRDALAYLKLINDPKDDISLLRIINYPKRGIGHSTLAKIKNRASRMGISLFEAMGEIPPEEVPKPDILSEIKHFTQSVTGYRTEMEGKELAGLFKEFLKDTGFMDEIMKERIDPKQVEKKLFSVDQLIMTLDAYAKKSKKPSLGDFLIKLVLHFSKENEEEDFNENAVHFLTIHAAKGLEFSYVYLIGCEEELLPYVRDGYAPSDISEERRLLYVAMTRAKKSLSLSFCMERRKNGKTVKCVPSRFLNDIPKTLIKTQDSIEIEEAQGVDIVDLSLKKIKSLFKTGK